MRKTAACAREEWLGTSGAPAPNVGAPAPCQVRPHQVVVLSHIRYDGFLQVEAEHFGAPAH